MTIGSMEISNGLPVRSERVASFKDTEYRFPGSLIERLTVLPL